MDIGFFEICKPHSVALTMLIVSIAGATGLALGSIKVKGISLGIPGVMFTGLILGRLLGKDKLSEEVIQFIRDFGLIIFVYAVGVQVGPGFLASLRKRGLPLVLMAAAIVLLGGAIAVAFKYLLGVDINAAVGLFAGGTTNAPALGSATEAIKSLYGAEGLKQAAESTLPAFAIAYPFGLVGVIVAMVLFRMFMRVDPQREAATLEAAGKDDKLAPATLNIELQNPNLDGLPLSEFPGYKKGPGVVVSRIRNRSGVMIARPDTKVALGDVLLAVGPREELEDFRRIVGAESHVDLRAVPSNITTRQILVTKTAALGQTLGELDLPRRLGVTITRLSRTDLEFTAAPNFTLQFGDRVRAVGETDALDAAAKELGNSVRELNLPRLLPIFVGLFLGVFLGILPVYLPGLPAPVKLGLASGPMIVAIILSRIGRVGPLIWYMPHNASAMLRELGIVLFLIAVGLLAGDGFFEALQKPIGLQWLGLGAVITLLPLLIVGLLARVFGKLNYLHLCGLLAGSMTSPSLAFTQTMTPSEAPAVAFATVYPLTMILRVLLAQLLVIIFR